MDFEMRLQICPGKHSLGFAGPKTTAGQAKRPK